MTAKVATPLARYAPFGVPAIWLYLPALSRRSRRRHQRRPAGRSAQTRRRNWRDVGYKRRSDCRSILVHRGIWTCKKRPC
jgi:hypothetical protein